MLNKKSLLNRVVVGAGIFAVIIGMILLNIYFPNYSQNASAPNQFISGRAINSVLISVIILLAVIEMRRALGTERIPDRFSWLLWLYGFGIGPAYSLFGYTGIIFFTLIVFVAAAITALIANRVDSLMYVAFMLVYPGLFMATLLYINRSASTHVFSADSLMNLFLETDVWIYFNDRIKTSLLPLNAIGLSFVFVISTFTDVFAFFVGSLLGKRKLCPNISPKKTVEGAIGGIFGGAIGSLLIYLLFDYFAIFGPQFGLTFEPLGLSTAHIVLTYVVIGLFGSVATQVGDLLASMVKRYCGIKDYSRVLGEHGGIMDRFDGIMLNSMLVSVVFMFIL